MKRNRRQKSVYKGQTSRENHAYTFPSSSDPAYQLPEGEPNYPPAIPINEFIYHNKIENSKGCSKCSEPVNPHYAYYEGNCTPYNKRRCPANSGASKRLRCSRYSETFCHEAIPNYGRHFCTPNLVEGFIPPNHSIRSLNNSQNQIGNQLLPMQGVYDYSQAGINLYNPEKLIEAYPQYSTMQNLHNIHSVPVDWNVDNFQFQNSLQFNGNETNYLHSQPENIIPANFYNMNYVTLPESQLGNDFFSERFPLPAEPVLSEIPLPAEAMPLNDFSELGNMEKETNLTNSCIQTKNSDIRNDFEDLEKALNSADENSFTQYFLKNHFSNPKSESQTYDSLNTETTLSDNSKTDTVNELHANHLNNLLEKISPYPEKMPSCNTSENAIQPISKSEHLCKDTLIGHKTDSQIMPFNCADLQYSEKQTNIQSESSDVISCEKSNLTNLQNPNSSNSESLKLDSSKDQAKIACISNNPIFSDVKNEEFFRDLLEMDIFSELLETDPILDKDYVTDVLKNSEPLEEVPNMNDYKYPVVSRDFQLDSFACPVKEESADNASELIQLNTDDIDAILNESSNNNNKNSDDILKADSHDCENFNNNQKSEPEDKKELICNCGVKNCPFGEETVKSLTFHSLNCQDISEENKNNVLNETVCTTYLDASVQTLLSYYHINNDACTQTLIDNRDASMQTNIETFHTNSDDVKVQCNPFIPCLTKNVKNSNKEFKDLKNKDSNILKLGLKIDTDKSGEKTASKTDCKTAIPSRRTISSKKLPESENTNSMTIYKDSKVSSNTDVPRRTGFRKKLFSEQTKDSETLAKTNEKASQNAKSTILIKNDIAASRIRSDRKLEIQNLKNAISSKGKINGISDNKKISNLHMKEISEKNTPEKTEEVDCKTLRRSPRIRAKTLNKA